MGMLQATASRRVPGPGKALVPSARTSLLLALALLCAVPLLASAQEAAGPLPAAPAVTVENVESRLKAAQESSSLDQKVQARLVELYTSALEHLRVKQEWEIKGAEFEKQRQDAPQRIADIEAFLREPPVQTAPESTQDSPLADIEQELADDEAKLASETAARVALDAEPGFRAERRKLMPQLIADVSRRVEETRAQLTAPAEASASAEVSEAWRMAGLARVQAAEAEKDSLEKELRSYEARGKLLTLRQEQAARRVSEAQKLVDALRRLATKSRERQAQQALSEAEEARAMADASGPVVRETAQQLAAENAQLVEKRTGPDGLLKRKEKATRTYDRVNEQLSKVSADLKDVKARAATVQLSEAVGLLLRRHRRELPDTRVDRAEARKRNDEMAQMLYEQLELRDQRKALADVDALAESMAMELMPAADEEQRATAANVLRELLMAKRRSLNDLIDDYDKYVELLMNTQFNQLALISVTDEFAAYIQERVLWIRSGNPIGFSHAVAAASVVAWLLEPGNWSGTGAALWADVLSESAVYALALAFAALGFILRRRAGLRAKAACELAAKPSNTAFVPTVEVLASAATLAVMIPAALWFVSWRLASTGDAFQCALAHGLSRAALMFLTFEFLRQVLSPRGLAEVHFGWPAAVLPVMRRYTTRLMPVVVVAALLVSLLEFDADERHLESLGRLVFIVAMLCYAVAAHAMMHPRKGPVPAALSRSRATRTLGLGRLWYLLAVGIPLALAVAAGAGYAFTAIRLAWRLYGSLCFGVGLVVIRALVLRWLLLARRRLARDQLREQREALQAKGAETKELDAQMAEKKLDLAQVDVRVQRLVRSGIQVALILGLWSIWFDVLPALGFVERVELWQTVREINETSTSADGTPSFDVRRELVPITLSHLGLAILITFMTVVTARNLPSLLEMTILRRLPLVPGERYAVTTLVGYAAAITGASLAFHVIGVGWGKVQWLIAAMGVGLGFGLQEIFANFISGLILLFEQPIRVGDTVTIGGINGTVSKIRIRATRIVDWDRKELVVPNKEFVTGQLINWTLSDSILRVIVPVGIAYGSDTERALRTLYDVARKHPLVLDDPEPRVLFLAFGDSSLNFELRVFCPDIDSYLQIKHELHMLVDKAFREAGIEIAFPQRDVHVRSIRDELPVRHHPSEKEE
jgi:potassium-dependent mechanosensitive channel